MRDLLKILFLIIIAGCVYFYRNDISNFIMDNIIHQGSNKVLSYNEYYSKEDYLFVQNIDKKEVNNYQELLNMFYTIINSGDDSYTFYCNYDKCMDNVKEFINNENTISEINNFVNPYNSFSTINIEISNTNRIAVTVKKIYNDYEIVFINEYIKKFISENINDSMSSREKIKIFHDYIINNTIYDKNLGDKSYSAYNLLTTGKAICGGYSDIMAIYLNRLGIKNYRIASSNHIWNLVNLNDMWYHLDLTWDDPVATDGNQYLLHNYFLISTNELLNLDITEHNFNKEVYKEAN